MPNVVITGGPGAGKTTLLAEFTRLGFETVAESARAIIAERKARGLSPRPSPAAFAQEILSRDAEKYQRAMRSTDWVFFDRSAVEALGGVQAVAPVAKSQLQAQLARFSFHRPVFVLPPWEEIYTTDAERDQGFQQSVAIHAEIVRWYGQCGYTTHEVPRLPAALRAEYVLARLAQRPA